MKSKIIEKYMEEIKSTIMELYNAGKPLSKINSEYSLSKSTVNGAPKFIRN